MRKTVPYMLSVFSANTKPYAKRLHPVNQGPRGGLFDKKNQGSNIIETRLPVASIV
jgi:hypothetical protein